MPLLGAHVSVAGGVEKAPERAKKQGCEVMQIFVQSPQTFKTPETKPGEANGFQKALKVNNIKETYVHAPYLVNFASSNNRIRFGSISLLRKNLERASELGCKYLMTHLGSYGTDSVENGLKRVIKSLDKVLSEYKGKCMLLLELSAGSGLIIGAGFEEIKVILNGLKNYSVGVCLDTAHIFSSGYDITSKKKIDLMLKDFNSVIGLKYLKLVHCNDSLVPFNSKKDRHADIGTGTIGSTNLALLINHPKMKKINFILETPGIDTRRTRDLKLLKSLRK
jgi:deoxyribonuclease IV